MDGYYIIQEVLCDIDEKEIKKLYRHIRKNQNTEKLVSEKPIRTYRELAKIFYPGDKDEIEKHLKNIDKRIIWAQQILESNAGKINFFINRKTNFEHDFLLANYENCNRILNEVESTLGLSWWLVESRILLISTSEGKKQKTDYINNLITSDNNDNNNHSEKVLFNYILEQIADRTDEKTNLVNFQKQLEKILTESEIPSTFSEYLEYRVISTPKNLSTMLLIDSQQNLVDTFETFLKLITSFIKNREINNNQLKKSITSINRVVTHHVLKNFLNFTNPKRASNWLEKYSPSQAGKLFMQGNIEDSIEICKKSLHKNPASFEIIQILSNSEVIKDDICKYHINENSPLINLLEKISNFKKFRGNAQTIYLSLMKKSKNWHVLNISNYIYSTINEKSNLCQSANFEVNIRSLYSETSDIFTSIVLDKNYIKYLNPSNFNKLVYSLKLAKDAELISEIDILTDKIVNNSTLEGSLNRVFSLNERCLHLISTHRYFESIKLCVENILDRRFLSTILPIDEIVKNRRWKFYNDFKSRIETSIILSLYLSTNDDSLQNSHLGFAWDWFRKSKQVIDISDIIDNATDEMEIDKIIYFLSEVSIPKVLENHSEALHTQEEVLNARVKIVRKLIDRDPNKAPSYEKELLSLLKNISIQKGLENINQNKIYVDTNVISSWAEKELFTVYEKYQEGLQNPETKIVSLKNNNLYSVIQSLIAPPEEQILYDSLCHEYLNNKQGGLNFFLSMRIRHGKFEGTLRSPLSKNNLLTIKDDSGNYIKNNYWASRLELSIEQSKELDFLLESLSKCFDDIIQKYLHDYLRCYSKIHPKGKFYSYYKGPFDNELKNKIINGMTFDDFVSELYSYFKKDIQECLEGTKYSIEHEIFKPIQKCILSILNFSERNNIDTISEIIKVTQSQFKNTCSTVKSWFNYDEIDILKESLTIDDCIDVSLININSLYSNYSMVINKSRCNIGDTRLSDIDSKNFCEALYIIFENIYERSGLSKKIPVRIKVLYTDEGKLNVIVANSSSKKVYTSKNIQKISDIKRKIDSGAYLTQANSEGNSGILKLRALNPQQDKSCISFKLRQSLFYINYKLHLFNSRKSNEDISNRR